MRPADFLPLVGPAEAGVAGTELRPNFKVSFFGVSRADEDSTGLAAVLVFSRSLNPVFPDIVAVL